MKEDNNGHHRWLEINSYLSAFAFAVWCDVVGTLYMQLESIRFTYDKNYNNTFYVCVCVYVLLCTTTATHIYNYKLLYQFILTCYKFIFIAIIIR